MSRGKLAPEARIDLHGMTLAEAHPELIRFILSSQAQGLRLVLVITGQGRRGSDDGPIPQRQGILRRQVPDWWRTFFPPHVAAFLYGLGLGPGFLTYLGHGTVVVVSVAAFASGRPLLGAAVLAPFGLARGLGPVLAFGVRSPGDAAALVERLDRSASKPRWRVAHAFPRSMGRVGPAPENRAGDGPSRAGAPGWPPSRRGRAARSMPGRSPDSCSPWATFAATERPSEPAPSAEMTVILSTADSGAAAAPTTSGRT